MTQDYASEDRLDSACGALGVNVGELYDVCEEFGVDPSVPLESEAYFLNLLDSFKISNRDDFSSWLRASLSQDFISFSQRPIWMQGANWPFQAGVPMIFAGQLDVKATESKGYFHDDASIYTFLPRGSGGFTVTIIQLY